MMSKRQKVTPVPGGGHRIDGKNEVLKLLRQSDPTFRDHLLKNIEIKDPALAKLLKSQIFRFEDLAQLQDQDLRVLLMEIPVNTLAIALRGGDPSLTDKLLSQMSSRQAEDILDLLQNGPKKRVGEIQEARQIISDTALALNEQGKLVINRDNDQWV